MTHYFQTYFLILEMLGLRAVWILISYTLLNGLAELVVLKHHFTFDKPKIFRIAHKKCNLRLWSWQFTIVVSSFWSFGPFGNASVCKPVKQMFILVFINFLHSLMLLLPCQVVDTTSLLFLKNSDFFWFVLDLCHFTFSMYDKPKLEPTWGLGQGHVNHLF